MSNAKPNWYHLAHNSICHRLVREHDDKLIESGTDATISDIVAPLCKAHLGREMALYFPATYLTKCCPDCFTKSLG